VDTVGSAPEDSQFILGWIMLFIIGEMLLDWTLYGRY